jgi:hypothetical protein
VPAWEEQFLAFMGEQRPQVRDAVRKSEKLINAKKPNDVNTKKQLDEAIQAFQLQFKAS